MPILSRPRLQQSAPRANGCANSDRLRPSARRGSRIFEWFCPLTGNRIPLIFYRLLLSKAREFAASNPFTRWNLLVVDERILSPAREASRAPWPGDADGPHAGARESRQIAPHILDRSQAACPMGNPAASLRRQCENSKTL